MKLSLRGIEAAVLSLAFTFSVHAQAKHHDLHTTVIYGEDDRLDLYDVEDESLLRLASSTVALMSASDIRVEGAVAHIRETILGDSYRLCPTERFYSQNSAAYCSGFLVGKDTLVTAGHCIRSETSCRNTKFVFGFAMTSEEDRANQVSAANVYGCQQLVHSVVNGSGEDFAVIKLDREVTDREPLRLSHQVAQAGTELTIIGHPSGIPTKVAGGAVVRQVLREHLVANLDAYGGNSGSAVFNATTGDVEGILVRGTADYVFENGCRRSNVCTDTGCRGEDVTLIRQVLPHLEQ